MVPIRELLNRIRWDEAFGRAEFRIAYYDRIEQALVLKPLGEMAFLKDQPDVFEWSDLEGETHTIPLHRIKEIYRNGALIWRRTH